MPRNRWEHNLAHGAANICRHHFYKIIICIILLLLASQYSLNVFLHHSNNYFSFNVSSWSSFYSNEVANKLQGIILQHSNQFSNHSELLSTISPVIKTSASVNKSQTTNKPVDKNVLIKNQTNNVTELPSILQNSSVVTVNKSSVAVTNQSDTHSNISNNIYVNTTAGNITLQTTSLSLCPLIPPKLVGPVKVWMDAPTFEELEKMYPELEIGGRFRPKECVSRHKVAIIIPYRDREQHLRMFLHNLHPILQRQQLDYGIYVIEQIPNTKFNRAKLMNVGFAESIKQYDYQCFIFHDVDLLPEDDRNIYSCPEQPRHMSVAIDTFRYKLPYDKLFGGVSALTKTQMEKINGFSNEFWGWGGEDDDMANRILHYGYHISRYPLNIARYKMIKHKKDKPNPDRYKVLYGGKKRYKSDGINSLTYKRVDILLKRLYTWVYVDLNKK